MRVIAEGIIGGTTMLASFWLVGILSPTLAELYLRGLARIMGVDV